MEFRLLGPLEARHAGDIVKIGRRRERALLGILLLEANHLVPVERLLDLLWDGEPPREARAALHTHLSRLRAVAGAGGSGASGVGVARRADGYEVLLDPAIVDAHCFSVRVRRADAFPQPQPRAAALRTALALWRGPLLADCLSDLMRQRLGGPWEELRLAALEAALDAELACGRHRELIGELRSLVAEHPHLERFHGLFMLALYRAGRQAEALAAYQQARRHLIQDVGIDPGPELRKLHERILRADSDLLWNWQERTAGQGVPGSVADLAAREGPQETSGQPSAALTGVGSRSQLPCTAPHFTGRSAELQLLTGLVERATGTGSTVAVVAIDGMAGVGKTALAVQAAHQLSAEFPDGQLFVDLHGHAPDCPPRSAGEVLDWFLRSLGIPPQQIPQDLDERAAFYRARMAGTRTLILLDNAESEAQVRPLLPGSAGSLVLVTARRRLKGLDCTFALPLDVLPGADSVALLRAAAGRGCTAEDDAVLEEISALCGRLPLALRVAAALLRHRPAWTIEYLASLLRDRRHRVSALTDGEHDLAAVFDLSYGTLPAGQRHAFRYLGLIPGPDLDSFAAAALLDTGPRAAAQLLESLVDHNLLIEHSAGRYRLHDLLRLHARAKAEEDPAQERRAAAGRLLDYYLDTAQAAARHVAYRTCAPAARSHPARYAPDLSSPRHATKWITSELPNLTAAVHHAAQAGRPHRAVALAAAIHGPLLTNGPWTQALSLHAMAAETASRIGDRKGQATALSDLSSTRRLCGDLPGATEAAGQALDLARLAGDPLGQANALNDLGRVCYLTGDHSHAIQAHEQALEQARRAGDLLGQANALHGLGRVRYLTGDFPGAAEAVEQALAMYRELGNRVCQVNPLDTLGLARQLMGDFPGAVRAHEQALELAEDLNDRLGKANALHGLGLVREQTGDFAGSADALERARELYSALGNRLGHANALNGLGRAHYQTGNVRGARRAHEQALSVFRELGTVVGQANALNGLVRVHSRLKDLPAAAHAHEQALRLYREIGDRQGEAQALNWFAVVLTATGVPDDARVLHSQALHLAREIGAPMEEAEALEGIGEAHLSEGMSQDGTSHLRQALAIYRSLGVAGAARVAARLAELRDE